MSIRNKLPWHPRKRTLVVFAAVSLLTLGVVMGVGQAASTTVSVSDYSQCPNGTTHQLECLSTGWVNGALNGNNSSFREGEVTPQRLLVLIPAGASVTGHRIDVDYLARKGGTTSGKHAYDYLATYNKTVSNADRCQGLPNCPAGAGFAFDIPSDSTSVPPESNPISSVTDATSDHELAQADRKFWFFGPVDQTTGLSTSGPTHSCASGPGCKTSDDYAKVRINYNLLDDGSAGDVDVGNDGKVDANTYVQLLFGGHLAVGCDSSTCGGSPKGWGFGLGASDVSGGPYHIRLTNLDGKSVGNRDNQIMSNAVQPLFSPTLSSEQSWVPNDSATVTITTPSTWAGQLSFTLYDGPDCGVTNTDATAGPTVLRAAETFNVNQNTTFPVTTTNTTAYTATGLKQFSWKVVFTPDTATANAGVQPSQHCERSDLTITN